WGKAGRSCAIVLIIKINAVVNQQLFMTIIKFGVNSGIIIYRCMALLIIRKGINQFIGCKRPGWAGTCRRVHIAPGLVAAKAKIHGYHYIFAIYITNGIIIYGAAGYNCGLGSSGACGPGSTIPKCPTR